MNRRQRERQRRRRWQHQETASVDGPRDVLSRETYTEVKKAHIVPQMYQRPWAVKDRVAVHVDGAAQCVSMKVSNAGVRSRFYRRDRPDGTVIDDVEASLSLVEGAAAAPLRDLIGGQPLTIERKATLAEFFAVQVLRGPAFFEEREELLTPVLDGLRPEDLKPSAVARLGSVEAVEARVQEEYLGSTQRFVTMLALSKKLAAVLGNMRWHLLRTGRPSLAYSDHPVVVWPMLIARSEPFARQQFGVLSALEVRVPVAPDLAVLMTWVNLPDPSAPVSISDRIAAELNAFTIGQADRQWMHQLGIKPRLATGEMLPVSRVLEHAYTAEVALASQRRRVAEQFLKSVEGRQHIDDIALIDLGPS